ncbi:MAG: iron dicitrate transporter FecR [Cyclobacteriaceae bacterium]|nr:MAG: iron dicitrate transporter FecR [Cyclobacteriaceae bacterium]
MHGFENYIDHKFEDFIEDEKFKNWVANPGEHDTFWKKFVQAFPEKTETVNQAREFLLATRIYFETSDVSVQQIEEGLQQVLQQAPKDQANQRWLPISIRWVAAASILLLCLTGAYFYFLSSDLTTYTTDYGEWKSVELPDGSKVQLNANSELILAEDWSSGVTRQVWLKGEAFFTVSKKQATNTKFQVITDDLTVEVLGTEFNVQDRGPQTEVYLQEGKIKLDLGISEEDLAPGDFVSYSAERSEIISHKRMSADEFTSWKEGVLKLNNTTILEILREIEEIYGVEIMASNKTMLSERRTIGVPMQNLEIVIPILETTLDVEIRKVGKKLFIK